MSEKSKNFVGNRVVRALLQAYFELLDEDGLHSILREANMEHLSDLTSLNPKGVMNFESFKKIISAQDLLLFQTHKLLYLIGKKFSFYLFPFGNSFEDTIEEINHLIQTDWSLKIIKKTIDEFHLLLKNCVFCSNKTETCDVIKGFLISSLEKTLSSKRKIVFITNSETIKNQETHPQDTIYIILKIQ
ncbi:MAG: hypothetical protein ACTSYC_02360 [Promethearchaeota archaeon]